MLLVLIVFVHLCKYRHLHKHLLLVHTSSQVFVHPRVSTPKLSTRVGVHSASRDTLWLLWNIPPHRQATNAGMEPAQCAGQ